MMKRILTLLLCVAVAVGAYLITDALTAGPQSGPSSDPSVTEPQQQPAEDPDPVIVIEDDDYVEYHFRSQKLLNQHYDKHGKDMGFADAAEYEQAASDVINDPSALSKTEKEDGDFVFYIEDTNEFVVLSKDGYIRTYFWPDAGKKYYDKQ